MVRPANVQDIPVIVTLGEQLHHASAYAGLPYCPHKVSALMQHLIHGGGVVFVAERQSKVIGGLAGAVTEHWFSTAKLAFDYSFFITPSHRHGITAMKLLSAFSEWARLKGATEIRMGITTQINPAATARLYRAAGFTNAGILLRKGVGDGD